MPIVGSGHSVAVGYILWIFGFTGAHRFYYGRPLTGTLYLCTFGVFGIGWLIDAFLIPGMDRKADVKFTPGAVDYNLCWIFLTFLGVFGVHRMYMNKWISGVIYFFTGGLFLIGYAYDYWTLNEQISELNQKSGSDRLITRPVN